MVLVKLRATGVPYLEMPAEAVITSVRDLRRVRT
jgi:hypothetical protein